MKPNEFWNSTYREINIFSQANLCKRMDDYKQEITLQEAVSDKIIMADAMRMKKPKINSLYKTFENLFPKKDKIETPEDIVRKMRAIMKSENIN